MKKYPIEISVVVPMFNEAANLPGNLERMKAALKLTEMSFEIIPVDDGSTDDTMAKLVAIGRADECVNPVGYPDNSGRGRALRTGINHARGRFIMTTDADLSYDEAYLPVMYKLLSSPAQPDMVVGSPYMAGGSTENVPPNRLLISRLGNMVLSRVMPGGLKTVTGILRGYRSEAIKTIDLESDGKEIHLEILSKGVSAGFRVVEFPATLTARKKGKSKFRFKATALSHILFSFFEKPSILFGLVGIFLIVAGLTMGAYIIYLWQTGTLNPNRPMMTLMVMMLLAGMQVLLFGLIGSLLVSLRREIFRVQRRQGQIIEKLETIDSEVESMVQPIESSREPVDVTS